MVNNQNGQMIDEITFYLLIIQAAVSDVSSL